MRPASDGGVCDRSVVAGLVSEEAFAAIRPRAMSSSLPTRTREVLRANARGLARGVVRRADRHRHVSGARKHRDEGHRAVRARATLCSAKRPARVVYWLFVPPRKSQIARARSMTSTATRALFAPPPEPCRARAVPSSPRFLPSPRVLRGRRHPPTPSRLDPARHHARAQVPGHRAARTDTLRAASREDADVRVGMVSLFLRSTTGALTVNENCDPRRPHGHAERAGSHRPAGSGRRARRAGGVLARPPRARRPAGARHVAGPLPAGVARAGPVEVVATLVATGEDCAKNVKLPAPSRGCHPARDALGSPPAPTPTHATAFF